jgi:Polyketide cyclase / dehydrase and lipid transport
MLKITVSVLAILIFSILLIVVIGYSLPKKHVVAREIALSTPPTDVFALISDFKAGPAWRSDVRTVELLPPVNGHIRFRENSKNGALTMEVVESNSPWRMVTQIADQNLPFGGIWVYEITPAPEGCHLNITERGEIYNPIFRFVSRFILGYTDTLNAYLQNVARKFGSAAVPVEGKPNAS